jgi:hypothetical protein
MTARAAAFCAARHDFADDDAISREIRAVGITEIVERSQP